MVPHLKDVPLSRKTKLLKAFALLLLPFSVLLLLIPFLMMIGGKAMAQLGEKLIDDVLPNPTGWMNEKALDSAEKDYQKYLSTRGK